MSEEAQRLRARMKAKALERGKGSDAGKVDASDFTPSENLRTDAKTGARPLVRRLYRQGGKVEGAKGAKHAGRKARASGGALTADKFVNRDVREANKDREGYSHLGAFNRGGHVDEAEDKSLVRKMVKSKALKQKGGSVSDGELEGTRPTGGRMARKFGGDIPLPLVIGALGGALDNNSDDDNSKPALGTAGLGHKSGGRAKRASGGRSGKGKMNVNIIIATGDKKPGMDAPPQGQPMPSPPPQLARPPMPAGAPAPMPGPMAGPPMGVPPAGLIPGRKEGGRVHMTAGSGSGLGRLEKVKEYGEPQARKRGGPVMTAGSGSGEGRKEKMGWYGRAH